MPLPECPDCRMWAQLDAIPESDWYVLRAECRRCGRTHGRLPCSPYLQRPIRTIEQARKDMAR